MVNVYIPVEKHVLKYLKKKYGSVHDASRTTVVGKLVLEAVSKNYEKPEKKIPWHYKYVVKLSRDYFYKKGGNIARNTAQHLGDCLGTMFDEDMCSYLDLRVMSDSKAMPELKLFLKMYDITEDDVKVETLYKVYQRHVTKRLNLQKDCA